MGKRAERKEAAAKRRAEVFDLLLAVMQDCVRNGGDFAAAKVAADEKLSWMVMKEPQRKSEFVSVAYDVCHALERKFKERVES